jgi:hypothetical protein
MNSLLFFKDLYQVINNIFALISKTTIWGLPLDTTLHVLVGFLITFIGLKLNFKFLRVFLFLLVLETMKAVMAATTIDHDIFHGLKEFFATFTYPALVFFIRKIKSASLTSGDKSSE